jgi:hypothetical protein
MQCKGFLPAYLVTAVSYTSKTFITTAPASVSASNLTSKVTKFCPQEILPGTNVIKLLVYSYVTKTNDSGFESQNGRRRVRVKEQWSMLYNFFPLSLTTRPNKLEGLSLENSFQ